MNSLKPLLATLTLLCSPLAFSSEEGPYIGVNAIYGQIDLKDTSVNGTTYSPDSNNTFGGGVTAGLNTSKYFGIEIGFDGLDKVDYSGENAPSVNYWFTYLAAKPMIDFWKFNAFAELGGAYINIDQNNPDGIDDTKNSGIKAFGGLGLGFNFTPSVELDLSINRIQDTNTPITFGMLTLSYHAVTRYEGSGFLAD